MGQSPSATQHARLEAALRNLLARYGSEQSAASAPVGRAVEQLHAALFASPVEPDEDGSSLAPLEVARIRLGKFAASQLAPEVFRDPARLRALRAEILELARAWLVEAGGSAREQNQGDPK